MADKQESTGRFLHEFTSWDELFNAMDREHTSLKPCDEWCKYLKLHPNLRSALRGLFKLPADNDLGNPPFESLRIYVGDLIVYLGEKSYQSPKANSTTEATTAYEGAVSSYANRPKRKTRSEKIELPLTSKEIDQIIEVLRTLRLRGAR